MAKHGVEWIMTIEQAASARTGKKMAAKYEDERVMTVCQKFIERCDEEDIKDESLCTNQNELWRDLRLTSGDVHRHLAHSNPFDISISLSLSPSFEG